MDHEPPATLQQPRVAMNTRRNSSKGSLPKALTLSDNAARLQASLSTPPPTGFKHSPMAHRAPKSALFAGFTGFGEAPITPMTPDMFKQQQEYQQQKEEQEILPMESTDEIVLPLGRTAIDVGAKDNTSEAASETSTPTAMSLCETLSSARSAKRSFDATAGVSPGQTDAMLDDGNLQDSESFRSKRQMRVHSPDADTTLAQATLNELREVPIPYLHHHLTRIADRRLKSKLGACCYIKAVPFSQSGRLHQVCARVSSQSRPGCLRELRFNPKPALDEEDEDMSDAESQTGYRPTSKSRSSASAPRISSPTVDQHKAASAIFPLHAEVALLRAPLLGRLLLSGYVGKGDQLDLEFPHPQLFGQVIHWMYTGHLTSSTKGEIPAEQRQQTEECVAYLWGCY
jgi:hypothetical protein